MEQPSISKNKHHGACHCGAIRYEVELESGFQATMCNCSVCTKVGARSALVKPAAFTVLSDEAAAGRYVFGPVGTRFFCTKCGVHCYGRGHLVEVGGDYVSINLNTIDDLELAGLPLSHWDGRHDNWMAGPRATPWPIFA